MGYSTYTCPQSKRCGGCELLAVPYELQLKRKQAYIAELFGEVVEADGCEIAPIRGMRDPRAYRHKAATPFAPGKRMRCGFFERGSHRIVFARQCLVEAAGARKILIDVANTADALHIPAYDEDRHTGLLRHAVVRMGYHTKEALLTIVTRDEHVPRARELARRLMRRHTSLVGVVQNVNPKPTNAILGPRSHTLLGSPVMHDQLLGCTFEIGPTSFYQTNPEQTEVLYELAIEGAGTKGTLLDAYCGTGTIGICAAGRARELGDDLEVTGVERTGDAVGCARRNARANDVSHTCRFVCADATEWMGHLDTRHFDAVILDPPRAGSTPAFLEGVCRLAPERVVYVSCNPKTQVRDLAVLREGGYRTLLVTPVDLFPHTGHVETVCVLTRKA